LRQNTRVTLNSKSFDPRQWADFVGASPHGDVLQCLEWGAVKKPLWQPIPVALRAPDGSLRATALILKRKIGRTKRSIFYLPRGPIVDWADVPTARAILHQVKVEGAQAPRDLHQGRSLRLAPC
jgi:lipid II:glycine glycyltransferase (peptidoglycan interpeptide bridge formation enzyme)